MRVGSSSTESCLGRASILALLGCLNCGDGRGMEGGPIGVDLASSPTEAVGQSASAIRADDDPIIILPGGRAAYQSCVQKIEKGAKIHADGTVTRNGSVLRKLSACEKHVPEDAMPPWGTGWIEDAARNGTRNRYGQNWFNYLYVEMTVPPVPSVAYTSQPPQVLYLFPAFEPTAYSANTYIIQPVLQYGYGPFNGGNNWQIETWYLDERPGNYPCTYGCVSDPLNVLPGDNIVTWMQMTDETIPGQQYEWLIQMIDQRTGEDTGWYNEVTGAPPAWAVEAALEAYYLNDCNHFPAGGAGMHFHNRELDRPGPAWNNYNLVTGESSWYVDTYNFVPSCAYGVSKFSGEAYLFAHP